jgi:outer membrane protein, multidrug efflux system
MAESMGTAAAKGIPHGTRKTQNKMENGNVPASNAPFRALRELCGSLALHRQRLALAAALSLGLGACTVGPAYVRPEQPLPAAFDQAAAEQRGALQASLLWSSFGSTELNTLLARALEANTSVAQAAARLAETRALSGLSVYSLFPTVTAKADAERSSPSGRDPFIPPDATQRTDTYRAGFDAAWEIDLFGNLRNQRNAIYQRVDADAAALADVQLSIVAETAQAWFALRGARQQLALRRQQQANQEANVALLQTLLDAGRGTALDVARAQTQASSIAALVAPAEAEVVRQEQRLAVLTAWPLDQLRARLAEDASLPPLPALSTVGTPQEWLLRRPDVRAAERRLAAAYSDIGVEQAQFFPILSLLGSGGWTATSFAALGGATAQRWAFGPSLSWRFLDFGRVKQNVKAAEARAEGAIAAYRESVLRALEDTENALAALRSANQRGVALDAARDAAAEATRLARLRFDNGAASYLEVLDAERTLLDLESQALQARTDQATALAAVYKALAGDFAAAASATAAL